jgi:glycosyltransferase involved in cell wall biosynthesis
MQKPLVSFIVPTYNRAEIIGETLDSIKSQTYQNWECLVVDDGSIDNTKELIEQYIKKDSRFKYFKRPVNRPKGGNAARNFGFENSKGRYVNFVDSDDILHEEKLALQLDRFQENKNGKVCFSEAEIFNEFKRFQKKSKPLSKAVFFQDYISRKLDMGTTQPLWEKKFLEKADPLYDENILRGQDFDFLSRMSSRQDFSYCVIEKVLVSVRIGNEGRISDLGYKKEIAHSYLKSFLKTYNLVLQKKYKEKVYIDISNLLLKRILKSIASKDYDTAIAFLKEMKNTVFEGKKRYKKHYNRIIFMVKLLKITNHKGYSLLRKNYYLN